VLLYNKTKLRRKIMEHTLLLEDDTIGRIQPSSIDYQNPELFIGGMVRIRLHDENGNQIEAEGIVKEVLEVGLVVC